MNPAPNWPLVGKLTFWVVPGVLFPVFLLEDSWHVSQLSVFHREGAEIDGYKFGSSSSPRVYSISFQYWKIDMISLLNAPKPSVMCTVHLYSSPHTLSKLSKPSHKLQNMQPWTFHHKDGQANEYNLHPIKSWRGEIAHYLWKSILFSVHKGPLSTLN